ncbi:MAG: hypothetical protein MZV64_21195 [Ignavibacteriales bacterium]|nr:hypothetical protein [Ignavibacteriales bacterium]
MKKAERKLTQLTRYGTVLISAMQAWGVTIRLLNIQVRGMPIVPEPVQADLLGFFQRLLFLHPVQSL